MPASLIALPFRPVINQNGEFESGAVMTVYKSDSVTLEPLFADAELTTPLSNPLTANGFGVFPSVYWNNEQSIRVQIVERSGFKLFDVDPYIASAFDAEAILEEAAALAVEASEQKILAQAAADRAAISEAVATAFAGPSYANTTAGIAATVDGQFFYVSNSGTIEVYLNVAETAVLQYSILSASTVEAAIDAKADAVHTHIVADVTGLQAALDAKAPLANPALTGTPTSGGIEIGYRSVPRSTTTTTAVVADRGRCIAVSAGLTIPNSVFAAGDVVSVYNNSASSVTITQGAGLTLRLAATATTGNRTLAQRGMCTIWFNSASEAVISGPGLT